MNIKDAIKNIGQTQPVFFGGASLSSQGGGYGFGLVAERDQDEMLDYGFHQGVRVYDTAPIYGYGESEKKIGGFFKHKREQVFLITKGGVDWHANRRVNMSNDPLVIEKMFTESLKRLQTDYIDLYMIHWPDTQVDIRLALEVLKKKQEQGQVQFIGLCNTHYDDLLKAQEILKIEALQSEFNIWNQDFKKLIERIRQTQLIPHDEYLNMGWGTFDKGILTQRVTKSRKFDQYDARSWAPWWKKQDLNKKIEFVEKLKSEFPDKDLVYLALNFGFLSYEIIPLCGFKNLEQFKQVLSLIEKNDQNYPREKMNNFLKTTILNEV